MSTQPPSLADDAHHLLHSQQQEWPTLRANYQALSQIQTRTIDFGAFHLRLQFNPRRITSSAAKVDPKSIAERKCFLCPANLPKEQRALEAPDDFLLLCNPFPILPEHFTIPHRTHTPQRIAPAFPALLKITRALAPRYTLFYNGPRCGASAPDHLHFQAGTAGIMPIESEFDSLKHRFAQILTDRPDLKAHAIGHQYLRPFIAFESPDPDRLHHAFNHYLHAATDLTPSDEEPMLNLLASYTNDTWRIIVFPRIQHRPSFFFAQGENQILLSPASVDLAGLCITPLEKDFHRLTPAHLQQMFHEVCLPPTPFNQLTHRLQSALNP